MRGLVNDGPCGASVYSSVDQSPKNRQRQQVAILSCKAEASPTRPLKSTRGFYPDPRPLASNLQALEPRNPKTLDPKLPYKPQTPNPILLWLKNPQKKKGKSPCITLIGKCVSFFLLGGGSEANGSKTLNPKPEKQIRKI